MTDKMKTLAQTEVVTEEEDPSVSGLSGYAAGFMLYGDVNGDGRAVPIPVDGEVRVYSTADRVVEDYWSVVANSKELQLSRNKLAVVVVYYDDFGDISIPPSVDLKRAKERS